MPTATLSPVAGFEIAGFEVPGFGGAGFETAGLGGAGEDATGSPSSYTQPVAGVITDFFRPPAHVGDRGNRGWEYTVQPGSEIRAAQDGVVHFAGQIAGTYYVSINHADGLKTTHTDVADIQVSKSEPVTQGQLLASTASAQFHFGVLRGDEYIDPASLFGCSGEGCQQPWQATAGKVRLLPMAVVS